MRTKPNSQALRRLLSLTWALLILLGCGTSGLTPVGEQGFQLEDDEKRVWKEARELQRQFDRSGLIDQDPVLTLYVNEVAARIAPAKFSQQIHLDVKVLKHPAPNAFALPHGALYIHSGFLARMENEAQLAAVLGHETSHIVHRHTLQTFRNVKQAAAFASTLGVIGAPAGLYGAGVVMLGSVGALAAVSGYSQSLEVEADTEGLRLMVNGGYDPAEAVKVMENTKRYLEQEEIQEPFFFSTHPRLDERIASYRGLVATDYPENAGRHGQQEFTAKMSRIVLENSFLDISRGRFTLAEESIEKHLAQDAENPKAHFALAELFRRRALQNDQAKAEEEYKLAIVLDPRFAEPHRGIGLLYYKTGRNDLATDHFRRYLELNPGAKDRAYIEHYLREIDPEGLHP